MDGSGNKKSKNGWTSLHFACNKGDKDLAFSLIKGDGSYLIDDKDKDGNTALHLAAYKGHAELVTLLIGRGGGSQRTP